MKISHVLFIILLSVTAASAQTRPRIYEGSETVGAIQVKYILPQPDVERRTDPVVASIATASSNHYLPSPMVGKDYDKTVAARTFAQGKEFVQKTAMVTPSVSDGDAKRESPVSPANARLMMSTSKELAGYSTGDDLVDSYIVDSSRRYNIDPLLIYAQMGQESSFKKKALSNKGASGLMQLMPATARRLGVTDIYDPQQNIEGGVKYMRILLDMFGDVNLALAGYNAGEGAVIKYGYQIPPYNETQDYVRRISARYRSIAVQSGSARRNTVAESRTK